MILDIFTSVVGSVIADKVLKIIEAFSPQKVHHEKEQIENKEEQKQVVTTRKYLTFRIRKGLADLVDMIPNPVLQVLIEDEPTTAWNQASIVVESSSTGEWYASVKGEMSFEGLGGGFGVAQFVAKICKDKGLPVSGWVLPKEVSDSLSEGYSSWPDVKIDAVPIFAYANNRGSFKYILESFKDVNHS